ncbi:Cytochrome P450 monooxygenase 215 [Psilocybe cubensis]|uniref:Cytochrome P450 n=2 Tax=Psilocybe cubensis TaxID=181762 RepID=A0A8H8CEA1_PSICU|nr:Cytochrome P450 monooxygenase 215 [Psilocybe cubensis]KAH9483305.1 Cytochrome P450 monooxygenase 215 [Psilocybe cubensis]
MNPLKSLRFQDFSDILPLTFAGLVLLTLILFKSRRSVKTTKLRGPKNQSYLFGLYQFLNETEDAGLVYEAWAREYGPTYTVPGGFGSSRIVICDPRANAHFYSKETFGYVQTKLSRTFIKNLFGRGLLWAEGDSHRRQRKALSPAFSNAAIRKLTPVFYDAAYKMKAIWDSALDAGSGEALIDVQVCLDSVGIAGFGHDFHALEGKNSPVVDVFESFSDEDTSWLSRFVFLMGPVLPVLQNLPTAQNRTLKRLRETMGDIADELLVRNRKAKEGKSVSEEKSIIGLLIKAESSNSSLGMSQEEILAQNVLLLAGYETTSISLTWALIELSRQPQKQEMLREELSQYINEDPTFDQLSTGLPYLDAVVQEILRLHPPVSETTRIAAEDDIMPFSSPISTSTGDQVSSLVIKKGTVVTSPIRYMNRAEAFWGPNARQFEPERWLSADGCLQAKDNPGQRHILTFSDGPRTCLGRSFALTEFKAVLAVLVRNYTFELPDGPDTKIIRHPSILPRPKILGEVGARVPLKIRRVE